ncbi:hypothetical protein C8J57DRAFT_1469826 [Mycena rebaudengoi]|nr:hypothetical protein C8J57DRAFT_1469826 [Mycena rebaudengoi]
MTMSNQAPIARARRRTKKEKNEKKKRQMDGWKGGRREEISRWVREPPQRVPTPPQRLADHRPRGKWLMPTHGQLPDTQAPKRGTRPRPGKPAPSRPRPTSKAAQYNNSRSVLARTALCRRHVREWHYADLVRGRQRRTCLVGIEMRSGDEWKGGARLRKPASTPKSLNAATGPKRQKLESQNPQCPHDTGAQQRGKAKRGAGEHAALDRKEWNELASKERGRELRQRARNAKGRVGRERGKKKGGEMTADEEGNEGEWEDSASSEWPMAVRSLRIFSTRLMIKTSPGAEERNIVDRNGSREWW